MRPVLLFFLCLALPAFAADKVYRSVGPDGTVEFSDTPSPGAQEIQVAPAPAYQAPPPPPRLPAAERAAPSEDRPAAPIPGLRILSPRNGEVVVSAPGEVTVQVELQGSLQGGQQLRYELDGRLLGTVGSGPTQVLQAVERGEHRLRVFLTDAQGKVLKTAGPVSFVLNRPSVNLPSRPPPPNLPTGAPSIPGAPTMPGHPTSPGVPSFPVPPAPSPQPAPSP